VSRHIGVLEKAGLVTREKRGREHWLHLTPGALDDAQEWMLEQAEFWAPRLDALTTRLRRKAQQPTSEAPRITITRRLPVTPAEVYAEWLDPEGLREWMCPHPARPTEVTVDPVEGGRFRFDITDGPARRPELSPGLALPTRRGPAHPAYPAGNPRRSPLAEDPGRWAWFSGSGAS
jgi:Activator of Hsp90 ATPase homolog 1-like protein